MNSPRFDIRKYKKNLRIRYKKLRANMNPLDKAKKDADIYRRVCAMPQYREAATLLCFVSTPMEVNTHKLLRRALSNGKVVAVPYCVEGTRNMEFYRIRSLEELQVRTFGVLEPVAKEENRITDFGNSLCILPGLSFDRAGYRLGYGGGYYDRFLSKVYTGVTAGICYADCTRRHLVHGRYDVPCHWLITERSTRKIERAEENLIQH